MMIEFQFQQFTVMKDLGYLECGCALARSIFDFMMSYDAAFAGLKSTILLKSSHIVSDRYPVYIIFI